MHGDAPGTVLNQKYELLERAGSGGMAVVWRARTLGAAGFTRPVAIKRILPHIASDPETVEMFIDEAKLAVQLSHPNIARVYDAGATEDGRPYFAMEYVSSAKELGDYVTGADGSVLVVEPAP